MELRLNNQRRQRPPNINTDRSTQNRHTTNYEDNDTSLPIMNTLSVTPNQIGPISPELKSVFSDD